MRKWERGCEATHEAGACNGETQSAGVFVRALRRGVGSDRGQIRLAVPVKSGQNALMNRLLAGLLLGIWLPFTALGEPTRFTSAEHQIATIIPDGWKEVGGINKETALKISKEGAANQTARITVMTYPVAAGTFPAGYDVWTMADSDIEASGATGSVDGEAVKVLKFGRGEIDHHHMVWTLSRRTLLEGTTMWQLAYEGLRGAHGVTVQLTVAGDEDWYAANEKVFSVFLRVLKLSVPKGGG